MTKALLGLIVLAAPLTGCASLSTFGLARTLNQGAVQGWVAPEGGGVVAINNTSTSGSGIGYPLLEGGVRYGVTDRVELGGRLGFNGVALEGKFGLLRSPTMESGFNLSLNPGVGFVGFGASSGSTGGGGGFVGTLSFYLPVLMGIDVGGHEIVIGPRLIDQVLFGSFTDSAGSTTSTANLLYLGGSFGVAFRASDSVRILPEASVGVPVNTSVNDTGSSAFGGLIFQLGVGILFGSSDQYTTPAPAPAPAPAPVRYR